MSPVDPTVPELERLTGIQSNHYNTVKYRLESKNMQSPVTEQSTRCLGWTFKKLEVSGQTMCQLGWASVSRYVVRHHSRCSPEGTSGEVNS